jgi:hypothetical protein
MENQSGIKTGYFPNSKLQHPHLPTVATVTDLSNDRRRLELLQLAGSVFLAGNVACSYGVGKLCMACEKGSCRGPGCCIWTAYPNICLKQSKQTPSPQSSLVCWHISQRQNLPGSCVDESYNCVIYHEKHFIIYAKISWNSTKIIYIYIFDSWLN